MRTDIKEKLYIAYSRVYLHKKIPNTSQVNNCYEDTTQSSVKLHQWSVLSTCISDEIEVAVITIDKQ